jgi:hypothetical protein
MHLKQACTRIRIGVNMPRGDGRLSNTNLASFWNTAKDMIARRMIQQDQKHFETFDLIDIVADQQEYDLSGYLNDQRITLVETLNADGEIIGSPVPYTRFQEKEKFRFVAAPWGSTPRKWYYRGRKIGLTPTPTESVTGGLKVYGIQHPHDELWGTISNTGLTTTAFVIPESSVADGGLLNAGYCHSETDYYKNAKVRVVTGAAKGTEVTISAFNPATMTATVTPAWTVADVTGQEFCILSGIPDEYAEARIGYAIRQVGIIQKDRNLVDLGTQLWAEWKDLVVGDVTPRHMDEPQHMEIPNDDLMDSF